MSGFNVIFNDAALGSVSRRGVATTLYYYLMGIRDEGSVVPHSHEILAFQIGLSDEDFTRELTKLTTPNLSRVDRLTDDEGRLVVVQADGSLFLPGGLREQDRYRKRADRARQKAAKPEGSGK